MIVSIEVSYSNIGIGGEANTLPIQANNKDLAMAVLRGRLQTLRQLTATRKERDNHS